MARILVYFYFFNFQPDLIIRSYESPMKQDHEFPSRRRCHSVGKVRGRENSRIYRREKRQRGTSQDT